jgi:hypothetical protein
LLKCSYSSTYVFILMFSSPCAIIMFSIYQLFYTLLYVRYPQFVSKVVTYVQ